MELARCEQNTKEKRLCLHSHGPSRFTFFTLAFPDQSFAWFVTLMGSSGPCACLTVAHGWDAIASPRNRTVIHAFKS